MEYTISVLSIYWLNEIKFRNSVPLYAVKISQLIYLIYAIYAHIFGLARRQISVVRYVSKLIHFINTVLHFYLFLTLLVWLHISLVQIFIEHINMNYKCALMLMPHRLLFNSVALPIRIQNKQLSLLIYLFKLVYYCLSVCGRRICYTYMALLFVFSCCHCMYISSKVPPASAWMPLCDHIWRCIKQEKTK